MVMESEHTLARADVVNNALGKVMKAGAEYKLGLRKADQDTYNIVFVGMHALLFLEGLQFMSSFPATFAIPEQGWCQSIGKAVQKIMLDEVDVHAALDMAVIQIERKTERGQVAWQQCKGEIRAMLIEIVLREYSFSKTSLFADGRAIIGYNLALSRDWLSFNAWAIADALGIDDLPFERVLKNPLPWMENWIDIDKTQNAMQEATGNNYALNVVKDDLGDAELEF
jgi:ribonucleoside-diphosphate reductase beta chain